MASDLAVAYVPSAVWLGREGDAARDEGRRSDPARGPRKRPAPLRGSVLIVDDDPDIRTMLRIHFEIEGYNVFEASDGNRAWRLIQDKHPKVVVADVHMPGRTGLELCRLARDAGFDEIGFIAYTAGMATWDECKAAGFNALFLKTDPLPSLTRTVRRLSR